MTTIERAIEEYDLKTVHQILQSKKQSRSQLNWYLSYATEIYAPIEILIQYNRYKEVPTRGISIGNKSHDSFSNFRTWDAKRDWSSQRIQAMEILAKGK
jgi:hypothetical protein